MPIDLSKLTISSFNNYDRIQEDDPDKLSVISFRETSSVRIVLVTKFPEEVKLHYHNPIKGRFDGGLYDDESNELPRGYLHCLGPNCLYCRYMTKGASSTYYLLPVFSVDHDKVMILRITHHEGQRSLLSSIKRAFIKPGLGQALEISESKNYEYTVKPGAPLRPNFDDGKIASFKKLYMDGAGELKIRNTYPEYTAEELIEGVPVIKNNCKALNTEVAQADDADDDY